MHALITGATGLIGKQLVRRFKNPIVLSRDPQHAQTELAGVVAHAWNPVAEPPPEGAFRDVDVVINLAGESLGNAAWTAEKKKRIVESRVLGTRNLIAGLRALSVRPKHLISASAVGFYGDRGNHELDEASPQGTGFLAELAAAWEQEALTAASLGIRVVLLRLGLVLGNGGALAPMVKVFQKGLGGKLGKGTQWMPWIHVDDVLGLIMLAIRDDSLHGPMNLVSPQLVTNADFTRALGSVLRRPTFLHAPSFLLRLALGERSELLTSSQRVLPGIALKAKYRFLHPEIRGAIENALGESPAGPPR